MPHFSHAKFVKVLILAALFGLLVFINPGRVFNPLRNGMHSALMPFQKFFYSLSLEVAGVKDFFGSIGKLKVENEQLLKENQSLQAENASLHDLQNENAMLREQIGVLPRDTYNLVAAGVVSQDANGGNWLEIDKGSEDGIAEGMPVIVGKGILIGKISDVSASSSRILLLTNPKSTVNVMTTQTGAKGVVKGEYGLGIIFDMILQTDSVQPGNEVVTSGIGSSIPRGLYVGTVQEVHPSDDHLFQQAAVISPVQTSKLQVAFVITSNK